MTQDRGPLILKLSLPFVLLLFFFGCIILPLLLKDLRGHSKLYMILHQVNIVLCVTLIFVARMIDDRMNMEMFEQFFVMDRIDPVKHWYISLVCCTIFKQFFYYQYHAFIFLQCAHYRSMICDPLRFKEFSASKKVAERIAIALVISSLLLLDDIMLYLVHKFEIRYYSLAELSLLKLLYIGALAKMSYDIKNSLSQAEIVRDDQATRKPLYYVVAVIPLINGIICSVVDTTTEAISVYLETKMETNHCRSFEEGFKDKVQIPAVASVYLLTSVISTCGYLKYFPKLRICCRKTE